MATELPGDESGGCFVVCRLLDGSYWDGKKWVDGWKWAKQYPPAPADGHGQASQERDRLKTIGDDCFVLYIPRQNQASR
jgi:hypothetical protein